MKLLSPFYKIRGALAAWRDADPRQAGRLGTVLKFFAVMLVLTLAARGIAGASMPVVTLTSAAASSISSATASALCWQSATRMAGVAAAARKNPSFIVIISSRHKKRGRKLRKAKASSSRVMVRKQHPAKSGPLRL